MVQEKQIGDGRADSGALKIGFHWMRNHAKYVFDHLEFPFGSLVFSLQLHLNLTPQRCGHYSASYVVNNARSEGLTCHYCLIFQIDRLALPFNSSILHTNILLTTDILLFEPIYRVKLIEFTCFYIKVAFLQK